MGFFKEGESDIKTIFTRITKRDFSGNTGLAIKNSAYQFSSNIVTKFGSLIFIIILARLLMPELFGLYNLVLATIMTFYVLSDLGSNQTLVYFISKKLGKNQYSKAKGYIRTIFLIKLILVGLSIAALLIMSNFLSETYYKKPLFLALIAGGLYIFFSGIQSFLVSFFYSRNNLKIPLIKDILFQVLRIITVPLIMFILIKKMELQNSLILFYLILSLSFIYLFSTLFLLIAAKKSLSLGGKIKKTTPVENKKIILSIFGFSFLSLSVILFGNIDKIILGHFVPSEFIGYYSAAFGIISSLIPLIVFSEVLFPIFVRMKGKRAENAFRRSLRITTMISIPVFLTVFIFADWIILFIFGSEYTTSTLLLKVYSLILIGFPAAEIFSNYLISKGQLKMVSKLILFTLILNILLAYFFPFWLLKYSFFMATLGVVFAMIIGRFFYLIGLIFIWRKNLNIQGEKNNNGQKKRI